MFISIFLPDLRGGGAERIMNTLATGFVERGHKVEFVLHTKRGEYLKNVDQNVSIQSLSAPVIPGYNLLGALPGLVHYLRKNQPDILLSALTRVNIVAIIAREISRVDTRLILSERNHLSSRVSRGDNKRMRHLPRFVRLLYPLADEITAVSEGVADDLAKITGIPRNQIRSIPNPAVTDEVLTKQTESVDHPWIESDNEIVLGVGSLTPQKNFETLIRAFATVRDERECKLIICGKGDEHEKLELLTTKLGIENDVCLPGFVENPFAYMASADVFVLSSRWEGLPNVLIEAIACGTPVVSTDCPSGPRTILEDGIHGSLIPVEDQEAMAEAIKDMLDNPTPEEQLRERADDFRPEPIIEQWLDVLSSAEHE